MRLNNSAGPPAATTRQKSIGPSYEQVAEKYRDDPAARDVLAGKILAGGAGTWGVVPMPPHPQHNIEESQQMMDAILSLEPAPDPELEEE